MPRSLIFPPQREILATLPIAFGKGQGHREEKTQTASRGLRGKVCLQWQCAPSFYLQAVLRGLALRLARATSPTAGWREPQRATVASPVPGWHQDRQPGLFGIHALHQRRLRQSPFLAREGGEASLRPALPPVQTAEPSPPGLASRLVAFANTVPGPISHILAAKSSQSAGGMAPSRAGDQDEEDAVPSHLPEQPLAEGSKGSRRNQDRQNRGAAFRMEGAQALGTGTKRQRDPSLELSVPSSLPSTSSPRRPQGSSHSLALRRGWPPDKTRPLTLLVNVSLPSVMDWQLHEGIPKAQHNVWWEMKSNRGKNQGGREGRHSVFPTGTGPLWSE